MTVDFVPFGSSWDRDRVRRQMKKPLGSVNALQIGKSQISETEQLSLMISSFCRYQTDCGWNYTRLAASGTNAQRNEWTSSLDIAPSLMGIFPLFCWRFSYVFCHFCTKARSVWNFLFCHDDNRDSNKRMRTFLENFAMLQHVIIFWNIVLHFN